MNVDHKLQRLGEALERGESPHVIVNTFEKSRLRALLNVREVTPDRLPQIKVLIKIASYCHLASKEIERLCDTLIAIRPPIDILSIVYQKVYVSPELIPQQYFLFIKNKLSTPIEYKHSLSIRVYFLLDQVVGFRFSDGDEWYAGDRILSRIPGLVYRPDAISAELEQELLSNPESLVTSGEFSKIDVVHYEPNQRAVFELKDENVYCYTLGSGTTLRFSRDDREPIDLYVAPRSVYVLSGEALHEWKHEVLARRSDLVNGKTIRRTKRFVIFAYKKV